MTAGGSRLHRAPPVFRPPGEVDETTAMEDSGETRAAKRQRGGISVTPPPRQGRVVFFAHTLRPSYTALPDPRVAYLGWAHAACPATGGHYIKGYAFAPRRMSAEAWCAIFEGEHVQLCRGPLYDLGGYDRLLRGDLTEHGVAPVKPRRRKAAAAAAAAAAS